MTSGLTFRGADFSGRELTFFSSEGSRYLDCSFDRVVIGHASFGAGRRDSLYADCSFDGARLTMVGGFVRFERCTFRDARIVDWQGQRTELVDCVFTGRIIRGIFFGRIPDSLVVRGGRKRNEVRGNDFSGAELIDCSFRGGIDLEEQRMPSGPDYVYVPDLQAALATATRHAVREPDEERRRLMLVLLGILETSVAEGQRQAILRERDYRGPMRAAFHDMVEFMSPDTAEGASSPDGSVLDVPEESFRKHWFRDRVTSSRGYTVSLSRDAVTYEDAAGTVRIDAEWAPGRRPWILLFAASVPEIAGRTRDDVVGDIVRACQAAGWRLSVR